MKEQISIQIKYTPEDYSNLIESLKKMSVLSKYGHIFIPSVLFLSLVSAIYQMSYATDKINWLAVLIISSIPALFLSLVIIIINKTSPFWIKRKMAKVIEMSPLLSDGFEFILDYRELRKIGKLGSSNTKWEAFTTVVESETEFMLFSHKTILSFIPKTAFMTSADIDYVRCLFRAKFPENVELLK